MISQPSRELKQIQSTHCTSQIIFLGIWGYCSFESDMCHVFFTSFTAHSIYTPTIYACLDLWSIQIWVTGTGKKMVYTYRRVFTVNCNISHGKKLHEQSPGYQGATEAPANGHVLQAWLKSKALGRMFNCLIYSFIACTLHLDFYL